MSFFPEVDDVFVREDLLEGKYVPDMKAWAEFDLLVGMNCQKKRQREELKNIMQEMVSITSYKEEL